MALPHRCAAHDNIEMVMRIPLGLFGNTPGLPRQGSWTGQPEQSDTPRRTTCEPVGWARIIQRGGADRDVGQSRLARDTADSTVEGTGPPLSKAVESTVCRAAAQDVPFRFY